MSKSRRRRHGRLRRWLVRPFFWALAAVALVALSGYLALRSSWLGARAATFVEQRASQLLDRPVTVAGLRFELLPLSVEIEGLVVGGRGPGEPSLAEVDRLQLDAWVYWRDGLRLQLRSLRLERPVLALVFDPGGGSNLPQLARRSPPGSSPLPLQVALDELIVQRGELVIDHQRLPLDLKARAVSARLWGTDEPQWRAAAQELEITLPRARPYLGGLAARGRLDGRTLEVLSSRIAGPDLQLAAEGRFVFGPDRHGALEIAAESGAGLLQRLGYVDDQLEGELDFGGRVFWDAESWGVQGAVASPSLRALNFPLRRLNGVIEGNREQFALDIQGVDYARGRLAGGVRVELGGAKPRVALDLQLTDVDLEQLMTDQGWPVTGISGAVSGPFSYRFDWGEPDRGQGRANLAVGNGERAGLAFRGTVPLLIDNGVVRTAAVRLVSSRQQLRASGSYDLDRKRGRFRFRVVSAAVEELLPLLALEALAEEAPWQPTGGRGEIAGNVLFSPAGPSLELQLNLDQVIAPGASADQLRGSLRIEPAGIDRLRIELLRPDAGLIVTGSIPFAEPIAEGDLPFALAVDAAGWPLEEARVWLPFELPVVGPAFGAIRLEGSPTAIRGSVAAEVRDGRLLEQPFETLEAELRFGPERVDFDRLLLTVPAGELRASGSWSPEDDALALALSSPPLDLGSEPFSGWWAGGLAGAVELDATIDGTLADPRLAGVVSAAGLALAGEPLGDDGGARFEVEYRRGALAVDGSLLGLLEVEGGGPLGESGLELDLAVAVPDLGVLAGFFGLLEEFDLGGSAAGRLRLAGRLGGGELPRAELRLERLELTYGELALRALEPAELRWSGNALRIESLYLGNAGGSDDLYLVGELGFGEGWPLDLRVQASVDTAMVAPLVPALDIAGGRLELLASVGGTLAAPQMNGQGEVQGARVLLGALPPLTGVRGALLFYPRSIVLDSLEGRLGGGEIRLGGSVGLPGPDRELSYRLQVTGKGLMLRYPEGWELRGDAELTVVSSDPGRQIRGLVELERAQYLRRVQVGLPQLLQSIFQRRRQEVEVVDEELAATLLDLVIDGPDALRVRNNVANLRGDIDLVLRGSLARPVLFGVVELEPGGTLQVGGSDYAVERGFLTFANPYRMEPVIDLTATTRRSDYDLSLSLSGTLDRLNATLASDPPLADLDVLGLLTTGEPGAQEPAAGAEAFLYGQAASLVTERVNRLFNLDRFRVEPLTGTGGGFSSARVTLGKQLSRDVLATYSYDPTETEQQILQLEWTVARGLVLVVTQNGDGTYAVDIRWEKRF